RRRDVFVLFTASGKNAARERGGNHSLTPGHPRPPTKAGILRWRKGGAIWPPGQYAVIASEPLQSLANAGLAQFLEQPGDHALLLFCERQQGIRCDLCRDRYRLFGDGFATLRQRDGAAAAVL